jgi:hypothetical protein
MHGFNGICSAHEWFGLELSYRPLYSKCSIIVLFIIQISNLDEMSNFLKSLNCMYLCIFMWCINMYCDFIFKLKYYSVNDLVFHCANKINDFVPSLFYI